MILSIFRKIEAAVARHRWLAFIVLLAAAGLWWYMRRPLATLVLPNGTTLILRMVSVGPEHVYREPNSDRTPVIDWLREPFGQRRSVVSHSPVLFLTDKHRGILQPEMPAELDDKQVRRDANGRVISQVVVDDTSSNHYTLVHSFIYPRREKTMRLNLSIDGQWHEWELPNPLYGSSFPKWNAQPFPVTKKEGDFEFTATGWTFGKSGWNLAGEAKFRGKPVPHQIVLNKVTDATGNDGDPALMPVDEPSWKAATSIIFGSEEPLAPDRLVDFGDMRVPEDGENLILPTPPAMKQGQQTFVLLLGKGPFAFRDGFYSKQDEPVRDPSLRSSYLEHRLEGGGWVVRGEMLTPAFVLFEVANKRTPAFVSDGLELRFSSMDLERKPQGDNSEVNEGTPLSTKMQWVGIRSFPIGTPIRVRGVRPEKFGWEMLVPSPSAAERAQAESEALKRKNRPQPGEWW